MKTIPTILGLFAFVFLASGLQSVIYSNQHPSFSSFQSPPPIPIPAGSHFYQDIPYNRYERTRFDFFRPPHNPKSSPLVIIIHGGGFVQGEKENTYGSSYHTQLIPELLAQNIAVTTLNYRYLDDEGGIIRSIYDCKRALQYLRLHADSLAIDPSRILLMGSSAGAGTALYIGLCNDMGNPNHLDPVLRQSTRVSGIIATETQATYDIINWDKLIFTPYQDQGLDYSYIASVIGLTRIQQYLGISSLAQYSPHEVKRLSQELDILSLMSSDDPELYVSNDKIRNQLPTTTSELYHHPLHALALKLHADQSEINSQFYIPKLRIDTRRGESMEGFILRKLTPVPMQ
ncbi:hypothetical protein BFP72_00645 [Reichenbachiella sp. 5M10]|uniref:alpha/beta hydrolase n=1 Tax=Reichenbachiella sp. 5M10 TaxID=1889772 RepID=UPI000C15D56C|nr:alpha/beta hydrolase [Reichenbachiella sp. 5M10]PIB34041.1 hypothetical protein BFP72_00645 [Reichenbachiella sp. 5M10]